MFGPPIAWDLETTEHFDQVTADVTPDQVRRVVMCGSDPGWFAQQLNDLIGLGFDEVYLHHVGQEQDEFLDAFGAKVLPQLT